MDTGRAMSPARRLLRDRRGAQLVEYVLLVGVVALVALAGVRYFGRSVESKATAQAACVESLACEAGGDSSNAASRGRQIDAVTQRDEPGGGFWGWLGNQARNAVRGGILGSFGGNTGWAGFGARLGIGFIPIVGQIADARDTIAGVIGVVRDPTSALAWTDLTASVVGWVPLFGDAAAQGIRGAPEVLRAIPWIRRAYAAARQTGRGEPEPGED